MAAAKATAERIEKVLRADGYSTFSGPVGRGTWTVYVGTRENMQASVFVTPRGGITIHGDEARKVRDLIAKAGGVKAADRSRRTRATRAR